MATQTDAPMCLCCTAPATWEIEQDFITGQTARHFVCDEHAFEGHAWYVLHNDANFAGPDQVMAAVTYRSLEHCGIVGVGTTEEVAP